MSKDMTITCVILTVTKNKESLVVVGVAGCHRRWPGPYNKHYFRLATTGNGATPVF
jgi:hypothetical protein